MYYYRFESKRHAPDFTIVRDGSVAMDGLRWMVSDGWFAMDVSRWDGSFAMDRSRWIIRDGLFVMDGSFVMDRSRWIVRDESFAMDGSFANKRLIAIKRSLQWIQSFAMTLKTIVSVEMIVLVETSAGNERRACDETSTCDERIGQKNLGGFCWVVIREGKGCVTEKYVQLNF